jgi:hypothetical protein
MVCAGVGDTVAVEVCVGEAVGVDIGVLVFVGGIDVGVVDAEDVPVESDESDDLDFSES